MFWSREEVISKLKEKDDGRQLNAKKEILSIINKKRKKVNFFI